LLVLNERVFRRGRENRRLNTLMVVGASNRLPEDEALGALFDRFLVRVGCHNVPESELANVLSAGWQLDSRGDGEVSRLHVDELRKLHQLVAHVDVEAVRPQYAELIGRLRGAGLVISDRRAVKVQRLMAASAVLCGRLQANRTDLWVLRYIWDSEDEQDILDSLVGKAIEPATDAEKQVSHPRSQVGEAPDPERIAADLQKLAGELTELKSASLEFSMLKDRLSLLTARSQWVANSQQRVQLEQMANELWQRVEAAK
jgi:MoxR-like ATPase